MDEIEMFRAQQAVTLAGLSGRLAHILVAKGIATEAEVMAMLEAEMSVTGAGHQPLVHHAMTRLQLLCAADRGERPPA